MSSVILTSVSGAPGVTSTALGLALTWPRDAVLVDADRAAGQAVLAGYLRGSASHGLGIQGVLQAYRERSPLGEALTENAIELPGPANAETAGPTRGFVPGFTHLGSVDLFDSVWPSLLDAVRDSSADLIVDAGRVGARGLAPDLVMTADLVLMVCRTSLPALAALRLSLPVLMDAAAPGRAGLVLVGPGRPYSAAEVSEQFGVPVLAEIPWEPRVAAEFDEGAPLRRNWPKSRLARAYAATATKFVARMSTGARFMEEVSS